MPGIVGIIPKQVVGDEEPELRRMLEVMVHEPFYNSGTYSSRSPAAHIGYVTIEGSFSDCMPVVNEKGDIALFLTGECYADPDVAGTLARHGHAFDPGDASYLVHLYEEEETDFFRRLNGWFNGIIIDNRKGETLLFNDRYGVRRLYYHETTEGLYFSTEAKSLLAVFPQLRTLDYTSLGEYLTYECVFSNRTLFSGIRTVPPGSLWTTKAGCLGKRVYCPRADLENQPKLAPDEFMAELETTFRSILPRYLEEGAKCLALTGGLDTRLIIACADAQPGALPCLTHGGMYNDMLDVRIARKVAAACGQEHYTITLGKEFLSAFPALAEQSIYVSDGLANAFESHHLYLNRLVRGIAPIKITGKYGSQVIKQISAFHRPTGYDADAELIHQDFREHMRIARIGFGSYAKGHTLSLMVFNEIPWWWGGIISLEFSQVAVRSPYLDNDFIDLLFRSPFAQIDAVRFQLGLVRKVRPELYDIMTASGYGGNARAMGTRARSGLYALINIAEKAYGRDKLPYSLHHPVAWIDRHFVDPLKINRVFLGRGDYRHYRIWTRDELGEYIKSVLLDNRTLARPFWNRSYIEKAVFDHTKGRKNRLAEIQKALSVELIHRTLIENRQLSQGSDRLSTRG